MDTNGLSDEELEQRITEIGKHRSDLQEQVEKLQEELLALVTEGKRRGMSVDAMSGDANMSHAWFYRQWKRRGVDV